MQLTINVITYTMETGVDRRKNDNVPLGKSGVYDYTTAPCRPNATRSIEGNKPVSSHRHCGLRHRPLPFDAPPRRQVTLPTNLTRYSTYARSAPRIGCSKVVSVYYLQTQT